jgi:hypothetical protein
MDGVGYVAISAIAKRVTPVVSNHGLLDEITRSPARLDAAYRAPVERQRKPSLNAPNAIASSEPRSKRTRRLK